MSTVRNRENSRSYSGRPGISNDQSPAIQARMEFSVGTRDTCWNNGTFTAHLDQHTGFEYPHVHQNARRRAELVRTFLVRPQRTSSGKNSRRKVQNVVTDSTAEYQGLFCSAANAPAGGKLVRGIHGVTVV